MVEGRIAINGRENWVDDQTPVNMLSIRLVKSLCMQKII